MEELIIILTDLFHWDLSGLYCTACFVPYNAIYSDTKYTKHFMGLRAATVLQAESGGKAVWRCREEERKRAWHFKSHEEAGQGPCRLVIVRETRKMQKYELKMCSGCQEGQQLPGFYQ